MNIRTPIRVLIGASLMALMIVNLLVSQAQAAPATPVGKDSCLAGGYEWSDTKGCADKSCRLAGSPFWVRPGSWTEIDGKIYTCDGYTGTWDGWTPRAPVPSLTTETTLTSRQP